MVGTMYMSMKVQLIVVQGKPEGKIIPLAGPLFRIGRGDTCHLRPSSEQVSREHAEFRLEAESVSVADLGSRNGTYVNGKVISGPMRLNDRDLVQIGSLTFAVSIVGAPEFAAAAQPAPGKAAKPVASIDDMSHHDIDAWLVADNANPTPESPSAIYNGETTTFAAVRDLPPAAAAPKVEPPAPKPAPKVEPPAPKPAPKAVPAQVAAHADDDEDFERLPEGEGDGEEETDDDEGAEGGEEASSEQDFMDESNPFYVKKKKEEPAPTSKQAMQGNSSDAASEILRKLMDRRRTPG